MNNCPSKRPGLHAFFEKTVATIGEGQFATSMTVLASLPPMLLFLTLGAIPMVAFVAGLAVVVLGIGVMLREHGGIPAERARAPLIAGAFMLALASGVQTISWQLRLSDDDSVMLLIAGSFAFLVVAVVSLLIHSLVHWIRRLSDWKRQRDQKRKDPSE